MELKAGDRIDAHLQVERLIGKGGMGAVYLVTDLRLGLQRALKLVPPQLQGEETFARFEREAQTLARFDAEGGVARVHAFGRSTFGPYMLTDFVEGLTLAAELKSGPFESKRAAEVTRRLALTLDRVHAHGVAHRDIKPENVILRAESEHPVLLDFGLASHAAGEERLTRTGALIGTPLYMPPEAIQDAKACEGAAWDVYSLGALLFHCLSGRPPYRPGASVFNLLAEINRSPPPPLPSLVPSVDRSLAWICAQAMARDAGDRPDAGLLAEWLNRWARGEVFGAEHARRRVRLGVALVTVGVVLGVSLGFGVVLTSKKRIGQATTPTPSLGAESGPSKQRIHLERALRGRTDPARERAVKVALTCLKTEPETIAALAPKIEAAVLDVYAKRLKLAPLGDPQLAPILSASATLEVSEEALLAVRARYLEGQSKAWRARLLAAKDNEDCRPLFRRLHEITTTPPPDARVAAWAVETLEPLIKPFVDVAYTGMHYRSRGTEFAHMRVLWLERALLRLAPKRGLNPQLRRFLLEALNAGGATNSPRPPEMLAVAVDFDLSSADEAMFRSLKSITLRQDFSRTHMLPRSRAVIEAFQASVHLGANKEELVEAATRALTFPDLHRGHRAEMSLLRLAHSPSPLSLRALAAGFEACHAVAETHPWVTLEAVQFEVNEWIRRGKFEREHAKVYRKLLTTLEGVFDRFPGRDSLEMADYRASSLESLAEVDGYTGNLKAAHEHLVLALEVLPLPAGEERARRPFPGLIQLRRWDQARELQALHEASGNFNTDPFFLHDSVVLFLHDGDRERALVYRQRLSTLLAKVHSEDAAAQMQQRYRAHRFETRIALVERMIADADRLLKK